MARISLGLPQLGLIPGLGSDQAFGALSLLSGSHTLRVWYGGPHQQRLAVLDQSGETDLFRNGSSLWEWTSADRTAVHRTLPATGSDPAGSGPAGPAAGPLAALLPGGLSGLTPSVAALRVLGRLRATTTVSTDHPAQVAGRQAYVLVLTPTAPGSRVGRIRISVDARTKVPLGVQVYPTGADRPALDVAFTRFVEGTPPAANFTWTPPPGATVRPAPPVVPGLPVRPGALAAHPIGTGWTAVLKVSGLPTRAQWAKADPRLAELVQLLPAVQGRWGSGHLVQSALLSVLLTDDGRAYLGAVDPAVLYRAAAG